MHLAQRKLCRGGGCLTLLLTQLYLLVPSSILPISDAKFGERHPNAHV